MTGDGYGYVNLGSGADDAGRPTFGGVDGSTRNPPAGWLYEAPDWSVGLSGGWLHEDCPWFADYIEAPAGRGEPVGLPEVEALGPADAEVAGVVYLSRLSCPCGASVVVAKGA